MKSTRLFLAFPAIFATFFSACGSTDSSNSGVASLKPVDPDKVSGSAKEYTTRDVQVNFLWKVVDPTGLNCRENKLGSVKTDIKTSRVITTFKKDQLIFLSGRIVTNLDGKPWTPAFFDASACLVRANSMFIEPVDMPLDYSANYLKEVNGPRAFTAFWGVIHPSGKLECKAKTDSTSLTIRTFTNETIRDKATEQSTDPKLEFKALVAAGRAKPSIVMERVLDSKKTAWFKILNAQDNSECYIPANRESLRPFHG